MFKSLKSKLVFKLTYFFILFVFVPLLVMTVFNFVNIKNKHKEANQNYLLDAILGFEQNFDSELNRYDNIISSLIENKIVVEYPKNQNNLAYVQTAYELVSDFTGGEDATFKSVSLYYFDEIVNEENKFFFSSQKVESEKWYKSFFSSEKFSMWGTIVGGDGGSLYRISKLVDRTEEIGVAVFEIDIEKIVRTVSLELRNDSKIFAFDSQSLGFYMATDADDNTIAEILERNGFFIRSSNDSTIFSFKDKRRLYAVKNIPEYSLTIGCFSDNSTSFFNDSSFVLLVLVFLILIVCILIFYRFIVSIFRTLNRDIEKMNDCIENNFTGRLAISRSDEIGRIEKQFNYMLDRLDALSKKNILREQYQKQAEIKALQNQMNPHFIYNMLNTFRMKLIINGNQKTAEEIAKFGKLLRYNMNNRDNCISLAEEITHLNYYIDLQNERFTEKILYDAEIPDGYNDIKIPKFILQPLAENSFKYGKKPSVPLKITVSLEKINSECILLSFMDNGKGCDEKTVSKLNAQLAAGRYVYKTDTETSSTIGLKNINERIRLIYGEDYHITVNSEPDNFFEVVFRFPITKE